MSRATNPAKNRPRLDELLSAAEDDALSAAEREELDRLLAASPDAGAVQARYRRLGEYLERAPALEPPADLADRILAGVRTPETTSRRPVRAWGRLFSPAHLGPAHLGYGLAAAAGAFLAVTLYESRTSLLDIPDVSRVTGSLAPDGTGRVLIDSFEFDSAGIVVAARLTDQQGQLVLDIRFNTDNPLEVVARTNVEGLVFDGLMQASGNRPVTTLAADRLVIEGKGRQAVAAVLHAEVAGGASTRIRLTLTSEGRTLHEDILEIHQPNDGRPIKHRPGDRE